MKYFLSLIFKNIKLFTISITLIVALGLQTISTMPKSEDPLVSMPINIVRVVADGLSAKEIESKIAVPLEIQLQQLYNLKQIESVIKPNALSVTVKFNHGVNTERSYENVLAALSKAERNFPQQVKSSFVVKASPSSVGFIQYALTSKSNDKVKLQRETETIKKRLSAITDVMQVTSQGIAPQIIEISPKHELLYEAGVSLQTFNHILSTTLTTGKGLSIQGGKQTPIMANEPITSINQLSESIIKLNGLESPLSYFSQIKFSDTGQYEKTVINGKLASIISVQQAEGTNVFDVVKAVKSEIELYKNSLSTDISITEILDQSIDIKQKILGFSQNLIFGVLLLFIVLFIFVGRGESIVVALSIPLVFLITIITINFLGLGLQQMTIAGLVISLGLVVDNAIVIVEGFNKYKRTEPSLINAASKSVEEFGLPIIAGTLTTVCAFMPLLMLKTDTGDFLKGMPITVSVALITSLIVSLFVLPAFLPFLNRLSGKGKVGALERIGNIAYKPILNKALLNPVKIIILFTIISGAMLSLAPSLGVSMFPEAEKNIIVIRGRLDPNAGLTLTEKVARDIQREIESDDRIVKTITNIGSSSPRIYYNHIPVTGETNFFEILAFTEKFDSKLMKSIIEKFKRINHTSAVIEIFQFRQGPVEDKPVTIRLYGQDLEELHTYSRTIESEMHSIKGLRNIENPLSITSSTISAKANEENVQSSPVKSEEVKSSIKLFYSDTTVGKMDNRRGESYPIVIRNNQENENKLNYIQVKDHTDIPLSAFVTFKTNEEFGSYHRTNGIRVAKIMADALPEDVATATSSIEHYLKNLELPQGMYYEIDGEEKNRKEAFGGLGESFLVALCLVILLIVWQFKSFRQLAAITSILPIALAGGVLGLWIGGHSFSMMAFIGVISLVGIIVNDSIILIDEFNKRKSSRSPIEAIIIASNSRFSPIIITTITTVVGLLPMAIYGGQMWSPLASVVISGLLLATFSTLLFLPSVLLLITKKQKGIS